MSYPNWRSSRRVVVSSSIHHPGLWFSKMQFLALQRASPIYIKAVFAAHSHLKVFDG